MVGKSWMDAVFMATRRHCSLVAMPVPSFMARQASIPIGVAAFPRPRRLAVTLAQRAEKPSGLCRSVGKRCPSSGESSLDRFSRKPLRRISSPTPHQRHMGPANASESSMAVVAPSMAALDTAPAVPKRIPQRMDIRTIPVHSQDNIKIPPKFSGAFAEIPKK